MFVMIQHFECLSMFSQQFKPFLPAVQLFSHRIISNLLPVIYIATKLLKQPNPVDGDRRVVLDCVAFVYVKQVNTNQPGAEADLFKNKIRLSEKKPIHEETKYHLGQMQRWMKIEETHIFRLVKRI